MVTQSPTSRTPSTPPRRDGALTRERIVAAAIALLDSNGETGLTFRALAERLATGAGAIYWHIANKDDLIASACDAIVAETLGAPPQEASAQAIIRALAGDMFDAIDTHPWVGTALARAPGQLPVVRLLERIGQQVRRLGVPEADQWLTASALLNYVLGVGGQNAAHAALGQQQQQGRSAFLDGVAHSWSQLDAEKFPFTRSIADQLRHHDDRADFLAGIDLILRGIVAG